MEFFGRNYKKLGYYFYLTVLLFLTGCGKDRNIQTDDISESFQEESRQEEEISAVQEEKSWEPSYELTEEDLIRWDNVQETETEDYFIVQKTEEETGNTYPQIVMKEGKDILFGADYFNRMLKQKSYLGDYKILYADDSYICLWYGQEGDEDKNGKTYVFGLQSLSACFNGYGNVYAVEVQDDSDYPGPWLSNGITLSLEEMLKEIEKGNCYLDETAHTLWKKTPKQFIGSVRRQFREIEEGGLEEAIAARYDSLFDDKGEAYRMYVRDGRVGFYIRMADRWDISEDQEEENPYPYDFRIEVEYDWKQDAPVYHLPYEVYGAPYESSLFGTVYYPQVSGLGEEVQNALNRTMKEDLLKNLAYTEKRMKQAEKEGGILLDDFFWWIEFWKYMKEISNPMVAYQSERYLCIYQIIVAEETETLRYMEDWKRYHVYDLTNGKSLELGDVVRVDREFVRWLKEEKKIEVKGDYSEGQEETDTVMMKENLDFYSEELLLEVLENAEFWMKDGNLYFRLPYCNEKYDEILYMGGGTGYPDYIIYTEARIALEDLGDFLKVEPW